MNIYILSRSDTFSVRYSLLSIIYYLYAFLHIQKQAKHRWYSEDCTAGWRPMAAPTDEGNGRRCCWLAANGRPYGRGETADAAAGWRPMAAPTDGGKRQTLLLAGGQWPPLRTGENGRCCCWLAANGRPYGRGETADAAAGWRPMAAPTFHESYALWVLPKCFLLKMSKNASNNKDS